VDIRQIRYFTEVALSRSFKGAAARLNISQSSLSRRVADLERSLDTTLLARHPHGVSLTGAGQLLLERATAILRELGAIEAEVTGRPATAAGVVTVGTTPTVSRLLLAPLAAAFERPPASIDLRFVEGTQSVLLEGLDAGRIDVALMTTPEPVANCLMEVLLEEPLFLITRKRKRPRRGAISIEELDRLPLVMFPRPSTNRDLIERKAREHGITLQCRYEVSNSVVHIEFVRLGLANSILPYFAVADHVTRSSLAGDTDQGSVAEPDAGLAQRPAAERAGGRGGRGDPHHHAPPPVPPSRQRTAADHGAAIPISLTIGPQSSRSLRTKSANCCGVIGRV
jgi:LysR family transcriptional regulator, nitrogen assimilation regulatory protein